jgi:hypothetical protein
MSVEATARVIATPIVPHVAKVVLTDLADCALDDGGTARPALGSIAFRAGVTEKQTRRILRGLLAAGLIAVEKTSTKWTPTVYCVRFDRLNPRRRKDGLPPTITEPIRVTISDGHRKDCTCARCSAAPSRSRDLPRGGRSAGVSRVPPAGAPPSRHAGAPPLPRADRETSRAAGVYPSEIPNVDPPENPPAREARASGGAVAVLDVQESCAGDDRDPDAGEPTASTRALAMPALRALPPEVRFMTEQLATADAKRLAVRMSFLFQDLPMSPAKRAEYLQHWRRCIAQGARPEDLLLVYEWAGVAMERDGGEFRNLARPGYVFGDAFTDHLRLARAWAKNPDRKAYHVGGHQDQSDPEVMEWHLDYLIRVAHMKGRDAKSVERAVHYAGLRLGIPPEETLARFRPALDAGEPVEMLEAAQSEKIVAVPTAEPPRTVRRINPPKISDAAPATSEAKERLEVGDADVLDDQAGLQRGEGPVGPELDRAGDEAAADAR